MEETSRNCYVAGIGASAGGLESLEKMFRALPDDPPVAFVVVQHLAPDHKSLMPDLMRRFTRMPVAEARDGEAIRPGHVYLLPPGREVEFRGGKLAVFERDVERALSFPIDRMLLSLANEYGSRAICVILSGSGSDGSRGVRSVSSQGGLVLAESPETAAFDGMPRSAIETGTVESVASPDAIARTLVDHVSAGDAPSKDEAGHVENILTLLSDRLGMNFEEYKRGTILRRIVRRMRLADEADLAAYTARLERDAAELTALHFDMLIGVTWFFRDEAVFRALEAEIESMVRSPIEPDRELRAWVAGCATGEEAYSVAILFAEAIRRSGRRRGFKVFATDVHAGAIEVAGNGIYGGERVRGLGPERLKAWFTPRSEGSYQIASSIRQHVVFAQHDILVDTPFTNLDLVSCRNLLIYFKPQAQRRALGSLCYGLRIGGVLFLGSSESPGELAGFFDVVNEPGRLFRKRVHARGMARGELPTRVGRRIAPESARPESRLLPVYDALLERFMPPGFLVSEQRALLDTYGGAEKLLQVGRRRPSGDFLDFVPGGVRSVLAAGLARAQRGAGPTRFSATEWPHADGTSHRYTVSIEKLVPKGAEPGYMIWMSEEGTPDPASQESVPAFTADDRLVSLEGELVQARQSLQATVEELEASNEELQATNEELVASNEELQSVNEELHSVNEELHTVNAEHQLKIGELSELNRDMSHLLESIDVATIYLDHELRIRKYTPRAEKLFGLVEHDLGRRLASFNHPLQYPGFMADVEAVRNGGPRVEMEVRSSDGQWFFLRLLPYRVAGAIEGVVVTLTDASALAAAKARARQLSAIVESSADAIIGLDVDGRVLSWNASATRLYGYAADEMIGDTIERLVPEEERGALRRVLQEVARGNELVNVAAVRLTRSGGLIEIAKTMSPVRDAAGAVVGIATIDRDIREQKELERRLRESEQRYMDLYNNAPDLYFSVDTRNGRMVEFNDTFLRATGYGREEAQAMHVFDLFTPDAIDAARESLARLREGERVNDVALRVKRKRGEPLEVTLSATAVFDPAGEVVRTRSVLRDVSERRRAEAQLAEAARMREQFLAMVSHELRSPLHAINAAFQIIDSPGAQPDQRERSEAVVRRQTKRMVRLVDDLLDVSRILHGKLQLERAPVDLAEVVRAAVDACAPAFVERGIKLLLEGADRPMAMFGDEGRLEQVVSNLLQNALRATPPGRRVVVSCEASGEAGTVAVTDEGRGIEPAELESIFGMFTQSAQGLDRTEGGLGLGLTIARHIVAAHGGTIRAHSDGPGRGARFVVELPLEPAAALVRFARPADDGRLSIVVVEDQEDARESLQVLLELEGHEVATAGDGREGLDLILRRRPQVGLLDIGLPHMNGFELAAQLRERLGQSIKLVAMSGYGQPEDIKRAEASGFDRHLSKPVDPRRLAAALRELGPPR